MDSSATSGVISEVLIRVKAERLRMKLREGRLGWFGDVMRRYQEYLERWLMEIQLPGKRKRESPKKKFLNVVKKDMKEVGRG